MGSSGSVGAIATTGQERGVDRDLAWRATQVDQYLALMRTALEDCGWSVDALARYWGVNKGHAWRVLHAEKPFRIEHYVALPDDVRVLFERRRAEQCGFIVVELVDGPDAVRSFVSGLCGVLAPHLRKAVADVAR